MLVGVAREHKQAPRRQHQRAERLRLSAPPPSAALRGELKGGGGAEGDLIRVGAGGREVRVRARVRARARVGVRVRLRVRVRARARVRGRGRGRVHGRSRVSTAGPSLLSRNSVPAAVQNSASSAAPPASHLWLYS